MFKKSITAAALTLALALGTAAPALGSRTLYTDADSGFRVKTPDSAVQFVGKDFYGYVVQTLPEKKAPASPADGEPEITITEDTSTTCLIYAVPAAQVEAATGKKFSTKDFLQNYEDLAVMERNGIDPNKADYFLYDLENYRTPEDGVSGEDASVPGTGEEGGPSPLAVIPSSLLDHADISLSTGKRGKNPFVFVHLVEKLPDEKKDTSFKEDGGKNFARHDMQLALTSANDILYVVTTPEQPERRTEKGIYAAETAKDVPGTHGRKHGQPECQEGHTGNVPEKHYAVCAAGSYRTLWILGSRIAAVRPAAGRLDLLPGPVEQPGRRSGQGR